MSRHAPPAAAPSMRGSDPPFLARWREVSALAESGASGVPALAAALKEGEVFVRLAAAQGMALTARQDAARRALEGLSSDADARAHLSAAWGLGSLAGSMAGDARRLGHPVVGVRAAAVQALAGLGTPDAVPHVLRALEDEEGSVRAAAVQALAGLGAAAAGALPVVRGLAARESDAAARQALLNAARAIEAAVRAAPSEGRAALAPEGGDSEGRAALAPEGGGGEGRAAAAPEAPTPAPRSLLARLFRRQPGSGP